MTEISREDLKELLIKGWMTHDAMWVAHCLEECGMETTNRINRRAVKSMAGVEAKRLARHMGLERVADFTVLKTFLDGVGQVLLARFMGFEYTLEEPNIMRCRMRTCFARDGMERLGVLEDYRCGIFHRIDGWFEALGLSYEANPTRMERCLMLDKGECRREYVFDFAGEPAPAS